jgi:hypothetical protein
MQDEFLGNGGKRFWCGSELFSHDDLRTMSFGAKVFPAGMTFVELSYLLSFLLRQNIQYMKNYVKEDFPRRPAGCEQRKSGSLAPLG